MNLDSTENPNLSEKINSIANERSGGSPALAHTWKLALQRLESLGLSDPAFKMLAENCRSPSRLNRVVNALSNRPRGLAADYSFGLLLAAVNHSNYKLAQWIAALETITLWLELNERRSDFSTVLGYLGCCASAAAARHPHADLPSTVAEMLDTYGFEG